MLGHGLEADGAFFDAEGVSGGKEGGGGYSDCEGRLCRTRWRDLGRGVCGWGSSDEG